MSNRFNGCLVYTNGETTLAEHYPIAPDWIGELDNTTLGIRYYVMIAERGETKRILNKAIIQQGRDKGYAIIVKYARQQLSALNAHIKNLEVLLDGTN